MTVRQIDGPATPPDPAPPANTGCFYDGVWWDDYTIADPFPGVGSTHDVFAPCVPVGVPVPPVPTTTIPESPAPVVVPVVSVPPRQVERVELPVTGAESTLLVVAGVLVAAGYGLIRWVR